MNVAVVCSSRELFGSDRAAVRLAEVLRSLGPSVRLVVPEHRPERGLTDFARERGIEVQAGSVALATSRGIEGHLVRRKPDRWPDITIFNTSAVLACAVDGGSRILMVREWFSSGARHRLLARWQSRRAAHVVCTSSGVLRQWTALATSKPSEVIPDWLDESWFQPNTSPRQTGLALCVGRFNAWKGQEVLMDAWATGVATTEASTQLVFVGAEPASGEFGRRADAVARRAAGAKAQVVPLSPDTREWYDRACLVVLPSLHPEPFGLVVLEGLSRGCRVLAFEGGGPTDISQKVPKEALELIPRSGEALRDRLLRWASSGGGGQDPSTQLATSAALRRWYSQEAAASAWSSLIERAV